MSDFFTTLKADLVDRRLLPLVALACLALVGAIAYAVIAGGSGSSNPTASTRGTPGRPSGIAVSEAPPGVTGAVAETTNGASSQHNGSARDPFAALPESKSAKAAAAATKASTASSGSSSPSGSSSSPTASKGSPTGSPGAGGGSSSGGSTPKPKSQPKTLYTVAVELGQRPENGAAPSLQPYEGLTKPTFLPSASAKLIQFVGVKVSGTSKSAAFTLVGEPILRGDATCLPSATQCTMIAMGEGKNEQLEVLDSSGKVVTWELKVVSIASKSASTAAVHGVEQAQSRAAGTLLAQGGALNVAGMRFGSQAGVIVFAPVAHRR